MVNNIFKKNILSLICVFGILFFIFNFLTGCAKKEAQKVTEEPQQQILTFSIGALTTGGKKDWQLEGKSANIEGDIINLDKITLHSYKENNNLVLTSDKGRFDRAKNHLHIYENVVMTNSDGMKMMTNSLDYSMQTKEITNNSFVTIRKGAMTVTGTGLYGKTGLKKAQLNKDITVHLEPSTVITCKGPLIIDYENNIAIFNKDIVAVDPKGRITAQKADVYFDPKAKQLIKVVLTGDPQIIFYEKKKEEGTSSSEEKQKSLYPQINPKLYECYALITDR